MRGEVRAMTPASAAHGAVAAAIFRALDRFVEDHQLGMCFTDNTGFALPGVENTVRSPDAAFVRADRLPAAGIGLGWMALAPDLVVEILSPNESLSEVEEKLRDYRAAGTALARVIDPLARTVSIRSAGAVDRTLSNDDILDGGSVLPGLTIPIRRLFERLAR
jgi:Uma2 family endonuclease